MIIILIVITIVVIITIITNKHVNNSRGKEAEGKSDEAAELIQEVQVEAFGAMEPGAKKKTHTPAHIVYIYIYTHVCMCIYIYTDM